MQKDSATALLLVTTKHLHLCVVAFLNNQQDPSPCQKAQPSTCTWKLWSRQFLTQKLPKNKEKDLAAVNKEQFMLFLLASTFAVPHETYLGNMNCLLSAGTFPKLTSLQHDQLNVPQTVRKGGPVERYQCAQLLSFAFCLLVNVCGYSVLELIGKNDYISLLLKEGICRGQQ